MNVLIILSVCVAAAFSNPVCNLTYDVDTEMKLIKDLKENRTSTNMILTERELFYYSDFPNTFNQYILSKFPKENVTEVREICELFGGDLVRINDHDEHTLLKDWLSSIYNTCSYFDEIRVSGVYHILLDKHVFHGVVDSSTSGPHIHWDVNYPKQVDLYPCLVLSRGDYLYRNTYCEYLEPVRPVHFICELLVVPW